MDSSSAVASSGSFESWVVAASLPQPSRSQSSAAELIPCCKTSFNIYIYIIYIYIYMYNHIYIYMAVAILHVFETYYILAHR